MTTLRTLTLFALILLVAAACGGAAPNADGTAASPATAAAPAGKGTGAPPTPGSEPDFSAEAAAPMIDILTADGAAVEVAEVMPRAGLFDPDLFGAGLVNLIIDGEKVSVYVFADEANRAAAAAGISPAGDEIRVDLGGGQQQITIIDGVGPAHVWVRGRFLLWYFGEDPALIGRLDRLFGPQIADGARPHQPDRPGTGPIAGFGPAGEPDVDGLALQWDPYVAYDITVERLPERPYDSESRAPFLAERVVLTLHSDKFPAGLYPPQIVISGEPFAAFDALNGDFVHVAEKAVRYKSGSGLRWVASEIGQAANPVIDGTIYYYFKGRSADFSRYVTARLPLSSAQLPDFPPDEATYETLLDDFDGYRRRLQEELAAASDDSFTPDLAALDAMMATLAVDLTDPLPTVADRGFRPVPDLNQLSSDQITPADMFAYWALRTALAPGGPMTIITQGGDPAALPENTRLAAPDWCGRSVPPSCLFDVVVVRGGQVEVLTGPNGGLAAFLGTIESEAEALLLLHANDYAVTGFPDLAGGSWRPAAGGDGFEFYAVRLDQICDPIVTNRYLLRVTADGAITPIYAELWSRLEGCL